ncbi:MAG: hypothetical protein AAF901_04905 [Bacteroidota bacterium]
MKYRYLLIAIVLSSLCFSCEDLFDCIIGRSASLPDKTFPIGEENVFYSVELSAEIKNEPDDNNYDYFFDIYDDLPRGLDYYVDYRVLIIEGIPEETGVFEVTVHLWVDGPIFVDFNSGRADDRLCDSGISKTYTIIIE